MEADPMTIRFRPVGERFAHPVHGELIVVAQVGCAGCAGCAFDPNTCADVGSDRRQIAGTCALREDTHDVVFAKPNDYAVFKLTGEWP